MWSDYRPDKTERHVNTLLDDSPVNNLLLLCDRILFLYRMGSARNNCKKFRSKKQNWKLNCIIGVAAIATTATTYLLT